VLVEGKNVFIVGSPSLARAIGVEAAVEGADVTIASGTTQGLEGFDDELMGMGRRGRVVTGDLTDPSCVKVAVDQALTFLVSIDCLINCPGFDLPAAAIEEVTDEDWADVVTINLLSPFLFVQQVAPHFINQGNKAIVNVASLDAKFKPGKASIPHAAAMSALCALTRQLAYRLGGYGIRVNAVLPGVTTPDATKGDVDILGRPIDAAALSVATPLSRVGRPSDVANTVIWLASNENTWITGESIAVCGGERMA
jgi:3-oxoacyl-[acyl-carrier protein] reductase